jgi:glycerol-3-phosphate cytidylyltransferase-like family protein
MEILMGKRRNQHPQQRQDNIFAGNPFLDDLLAWRHSPEGEQFAECSDTLCEVMEDVQLDARKRQFIWPDGERLDIVQSIARIHQRYPDMRRDWIEEYLLDWIEMDYAPEHYSKAQLDELDRLTARWIADHSRRAKTTKSQRRTRHS